MIVSQISAEYNDAVRRLYKSSNDAMRVSHILTNKVLARDLADPAAFYTKPGRYMCLMFDFRTLIGIVGIVETDDTEIAEIQRLVIHPEYRRCGLGKKLMKHIHEKVFQLGYAGYTLSTIATNKIALRFYNSLDFMRYSHTTAHCSQKEHLPYELVHFKGTSVKENGT